MKAHYIANCTKQSLPKIRAFVKTELRARDVQESTAHQLVLAVDEACANSIIHHHSCNEKSRIKLSIYRNGNELHIELTDNGAPFPINEYKPREIREMIRRRTKGGLGIFLINKIMDKVEVIRRPNDFTYRFIKYL